LIVRLADSGRQSIDVVDAEKRVHPLDYQQFVTRHMCSLGDVAEWRMAKSGNATPAALIVRVDAREDLGNPEKATQSYYAVAKITPDSVCVTDRIPERAQTPEEVRRTADSAPRRPCARPLPPLTAGGETAR
jgi:hypothetical protein